MDVRVDPPPYKALLSSPLLIKEVRAVSVIEIKQMILVLSLKAVLTSCI